MLLLEKVLHSNNEKDPYVSKDLSILKYSVPEFIKNNKNLMKKINEIKEAKIRRWWKWSFLYILKKKNNFFFNYDYLVSFIS